MCIEKIFLAMNVIDRQTHTKHNNIANVIYKYTQGAKDVKTGNLKRNVISSFAINMVNDI